MAFWPGLSPAGHSGNLRSPQTTSMDGRMSPEDYAQLADALLPAVLAAGRVELTYFKGGVAVEHKADASPVTAADREAETLLLAAIAQSCPGTPIVAEEASAAAGLPAAASERFFLVDPLDGTREFVAGRAEFTVNIGLVEHGAPVFGIVYAPALGKLYATLGPGHAVAADVQPEAAARSFGDVGAHRIEAREPDEQRLIAMASRSHRAAATDRYLAGFNVAQYRQAGSSLKFCVLAEGGADIYPRHGTTSEWDTAAGHAVLLAAGGHVTTFDGNPLVYGKAAERFLNPHFVAWGRRILRAAARTGD